MARQKKRQAVQQSLVTKHRAVEQYMNNAVRVLNLAPWCVKVLDEMLDESDAAASISVSDCQLFADLQLGQNFYSKPPEDQRRILAHELGHLMVNPMADAVRNLESVGDEAVYKLFERVFAAAEEHSVERMAEVFASKLPLPSFG